MAYWIIRIPYKGVASIAIESDKKPTSDQYRSYLQSREFDEGAPVYQSLRPEIEKANEQLYKRIKRKMKRKSNLVNDIIKTASTLTGVQQERIIEFIESDPQMSFQQVAKFLAPKIGANESIVYSFLMSHDHPLTRNNDYVKRATSHSQDFIDRVKKRLNQD